MSPVKLRLHIRDRKVSNSKNEAQYGIAGLKMEGGHGAWNVGSLLELRVRPLVLIAT